MSRKIILFAVCAFFIACAPMAQQSVRLNASPTANRTVVLTLTNDSTSAVGYNLCSSGLQRRDGSQWTDVPTDEVCTMEIRTLQPGQSANFEKRLPPSAGAGEYRYVTGVEIPLNGSRVGVQSNTFELP